MDNPEARLGPGNYGRIQRRTGYTKQHVSRSLRGLRTPSLDVAAHLAKAAGVTLDQLYAFILKQRRGMTETQAIRMFGRSR